MIETIPESRMTSVERFIGHIEGHKKGPTIFFFGGIHGNEMAGVKALRHVFEKLHSKSFDVSGSLIGIRGNIPAQLKKKRFLEHDLNRLWTTPKIKEIKSKLEIERSSEETEQLKIYQLIFKLLDTQQPPFYFIDFHTTSSNTLPFITINDARINRKFSRLFPVPIILGIEEYLEGPLLSHMNEKGYVSLGFESGQHTELNSVKSSIAFMWLVMVYAGVLVKEDVSDFQMHYRQLQKSAKDNTNFYEVIYRHALKNDSNFKMTPGFKNFQKIKKGTPLGIQNGQEIKSEKDTILFMPLYQEQGEEGFFLIRNIPKWALKLSTFLRKIRFDALLVFLPGISWNDKNKKSLLVNITVARFFAKSFFHLLGYRNRTMDKTHILMHNRERSAKTKMYKNEWWYKIP